MSFIAKAVNSIFGTKPTTPPAPAPISQTTNTVAPTADNSAPDLDAAAQKMAASISNGRTSTMLTGGAGETDDQKLTSKVLLGQ